MSKMSNMAIDQKNQNLDADYLYEKYKEENQKGCIECVHREKKVISKPCSKCWNFNYFKKKTNDK